MTVFAASGWAHDDGHPPRHYLERPSRPASSRPAVTGGPGTAADGGGDAGQAGMPSADTGSPMINSHSAMSSPSADVAAATRQLQEYSELGHRLASDDVARYGRIDQRAVRSATRGMAENQNRLICARLPMRPTRRCVWEIPRYANMYVTPCNSLHSGGGSRRRLTGCRYTATTIVLGWVNSVSPDPRLLRHRGSGASAATKTKRPTRDKRSPATLLEYQAIA